MLQILLAFAAATLPAAATAGSTAPSGAPLAIRAKTVWTGGGRVLENAVVIVDDGRIQAVGTDVEIPDGAEVIEHDGVLTAGMIALHGATGAVGETRDNTRPALPEARVGLALDARAANFAELRAAGITSILVTPDPNGITGGTSALVKTQDGVVLRDPAHLSLVFSNEGLSGNREPTSKSGALALMSALFAEPRGVVADARDGKLPCLFEVRERDDIGRALAFAKERKLRGTLHGAWLSGELSGAIKESGLSVIVPVLAIGSPKRALDAVARLEKDGVVFGFGLDAPWNHADGLRLSAALCVRAGLDRQAAWQGLTANAAKIAGVEARTGRIERGLDADLVLWSGDPLDLSSRASLVLVGGKPGPWMESAAGATKESQR
ncbi:MAG: amidohydrolase family protein [Planctomycetota bacterium]|nr:amidohydrolase family protein [Planctomycetota bacterium]